MDLLENYLTAIKWNLPREGRADDIIAELRDVIGNRIEEREAMRDLALTKSELGTILQEFGHPLVVAARYGTQQSLIGPELFPFYLFSLKIVLAICIAIMVVTGSVDAVIAGQGWHSFAAGCGSGLWSLLGNAGLTTLIFAVIERTGWLADYLQRWSPDQLPDFEKLKGKPDGAWHVAIEVAVGIVMVLWWLGLVPVPMYQSNIEGLKLVPDAIWTTMWWPILGLLIARVVTNSFQWLRPRWFGLRIGLVLMTAAGFIAVLVFVYRAGHWLTAVSATLPPERVTNVDRQVNLGIHYAIIVAGAVLLLTCAKEIWQAVSLRRSAAPRR